MKKSQDTRRSFLKKTCITVGGLALLTETAGAKPTLSDSEKIEDRRRKYKKIFRKIRKERNYLVGQITRAAQEMQLDKVTIKGDKRTYNVYPLEANFSRPYSVKELREIWEILHGEYVGYLMEVAERVGR